MASFFVLLLRQRVNYSNIRKEKQINIPIKYHFLKNKKPNIKMNKYKKLLTIQSVIAKQINGDQNINEKLYLEEITNNLIQISIFCISSYIKLNKQNIEEMDCQYFIPVTKSDGKKIRLEIRHKNANAKKRKVKTWTAEEDNQLVQYYEQHPKKWANIAALMGDRNQNQCLHRYRRLSQLGINRKIWSAEEDQTIKKMIKKVGKNWKLLSQMIGTKTGKQIRERFINKLDPKIKRQDWSDEEDRKIIQLYAEIGSKWSEISKKLPGRPENKIKNRFYSYIQKNYEIKCKPVDEQQRRVSLRDVTNQFQQIVSKAQLSECQQNQNNGSKSFPSIRQIDIEVKQEYDEPQLISQSKLYLRSLVNMEEQWMNLKYTKSFQNFNENQNQFMVPDFFYLSNQ